MGAPRKPSLLWKEATLCLASFTSLFHMPATGGAGDRPKTYAFDPKAYAKAVMHGCKHSSDAVIGIFIGCASGKLLKVVDAIPLFHTHALAPMLKIACMLIEQHCQNLGGGIEIVGMYHATASGAVDYKPVQAIADTIAENFAGATVWCIDAAKMAERQFALRGWLNVKELNGKEDWKGISGDSVSLSDEAKKHTSRVISEMKCLELIDFDDHLGDASLSW